jgi:hypothetical protein
MEDRFSLVEEIYFNITGSHPKSFWDMKSENTKVYAQLSGKLHQDFYYKYL